MSKLIEKSILYSHMADQYEKMAKSLDQLKKDHNLSDIQEEVDKIQEQLRERADDYIIEYNGCSELYCGSIPYDEIY